MARSKKPTKKFTGGAGGGIGRLEKSGLTPSKPKRRQAPPRVPIRDTDRDGDSSYDNDADGM